MKLTKEQILSIPDLVEEMTRKEIGQKFNVSVKTVGNWIQALKRARVRVPTRKGPKPLKIK